MGLARPVLAASLLGAVCADKGSSPADRSVTPHARPGSARDTHRIIATGMIETGPAVESCHQEMWTSF